MTINYYSRLNVIFKHLLDKNNIKGKVKVRLSLCLTKYRANNTYGEVEV